MFLPTTISFPSFFLSCLCHSPSSFLHRPLPPCWNTSWQTDCCSGTTFVENRNKFEASEFKWLALFIFSSFSFLPTSSFRLLVYACLAGLPAKLGSATAVPIAFSALFCCECQLMTQRRSLTTSQFASLFYHFYRVERTLTDHARLCFGFWDVPQLGHYLRCCFCIVLLRKAADASIMVAAQR